LDEIKSGVAWSATDNADFTNLAKFQIKMYAGFPAYGGLNILQNSTFGFGSKNLRNLRLTFY
jgi:hypothetical protein